MYCGKEDAAGIRDSEEPEHTSIAAGYMDGSAVLAVLVGLMLLSGCRLTFPGTPSAYPSWFAARDAAVTEQAEQVGVERVLTQPETLLDYPLFGQNVALVTYDALVAGTPTAVTSLVYVTSRDTLWFPMGGVSARRAATDAPPPVQYFVGTITGDATDYGPAGGVVRDPAVQMIVVTFADGATMETAVEDGAYLMGRYGADGQVLYQLLDTQGAPVGQ